ncbi:MAG: tetratricopeptide repeat protein [Candidatus Aegiribacteria sp.]|nr:tetratricopeptide repeat protein [Candidatus Aegiribacteria sp.]
MNYAPSFIKEVICRGELSGSFRGAVLLADICGFTSRFDRMTGMGAEGAELISREVSRTLSRVVEAGAVYGGVPVSFAGDAVTLVFPGGVEGAENASSRIHSITEEDILPLRISVGEGLITWDVVPMNEWTFYSFQGSAVRQAAMTGSGCTPSQLSLPAEEDEPVLMISGTLPTTCFTSPKLFGGSTVNEFRQVISIFLSLENRRGSNCPRGFQELILEIAGELGAYVSGLEAGMKNYHILVVFGAPVSKEDDPRRADVFLQQVFARASGRVKAGTASGLVFSGKLSTSLLESYTVLGPSVNLAARLHDCARWNTVFSGPVFNHASRLGVRLSTEISLKGISSPVQAVVLSPLQKRVTAARPVPPLIERDDLLNRLDIELMKETPQILLTGVTGMGKTRLAGELSRMMRVIFVISLRCVGVSSGGLDIFSRWLGGWMGLEVSEGGLTAFREKLYGFIDLLEELNDPEANEIADELLRAESVLAAMLGLHWERSLYHGLDPKGRFQNTVSVITSFIRGHCLLQKTVIVLDDLQWINSDSAGLLAAVLEELGPGRPPVLLLSRPGMNETIGNLGLTPEEMKLQPLSRAGCRSFLEWSLGREPSEELLDWFHHRTEGIPFFMEQYAGMLKSETGPPDKESFPGNVHALLVARLDRLEPKLKKAALTASILGRAFDPEILQRIVSDEDLKDLLDKGVVERVWERTPGGRFSFIHILLREAAYHLQLHSERRKLHKRAAEEMAGIWARRPEKAQSIAYHLEQADCAEEASCWYIEAGRHAFSKRMTTTCLNCMKKVLNLSGDVSRRLDAHRIIYDLHSSSGSWEEAGKAIETAAGEKNLGSRDQARVRMMRANLATNLGRPQEARELLEGLEEMNPELRSQILHNRGRMLMLQGRTEKAMEHLLAVHRELQDGTPEERLVAVKALGNASGCMLRMGQLEDAEKSFRQVLAYATETGDLVMETLSMGNLALVYKYLPGRFSDGKAMMRRHLKLARKTGSHLLELQALGNLGTMLEREAPSDEAFELLEQAMELARKYGGSEALSISQANLGGALQRVGKLERALELLDASLNVCSGEGLGLHRVDYALERSNILMDMGQLEKAGEQIEQINDWSFPVNYISYIIFYRGRLLRLQNRLGEAAEVLREGLEQASEGLERFNLLSEFYLTTGDKKVLSECLKLGEDIQRKTPHWDLNAKLVELKKDLKNSMD